MHKIFKFLLETGLLVALSTVVIPCAPAKDRVFRGKVIDADTGAPIEEAVVVIYWYEETRTLIGDSNARLKDVKETLTDKNGEWSFVGEEGEPYNPHPYFSLILPIYYTKEPEFIIFKPGYCSWPKGFYIETCAGRLKPAGNEKLSKGETVELLKLLKKEDRLRNLPGPVSGERSLEKQKEFIRLLNEENANLGLRGRYRMGSE
jgi:hypothetical protein